MLFLSYLCTIIACDFFFNLPVVTIPSLGQVVGLRMRSVSGRSFLAFRGVPYAQPPVGELRFRDPEPVKSWQGRVFDGTKDGPVCISNFALLDVIVGVEDCLTLHIYTHDTRVTNQLKPVIFYIHGGGWYTGSGNSANIGPQYLLDRDIVLVTVNYRLGPLGFLTTEDAEAPGNYGLLDQSMALRWVQNNIRYFGGNPDSVTIHGTSAGSASVLYHVLSPHSKGLFHRAISESGSPLNPWAREPTVGEYSRKLAASVNCHSSSSSEQIACLRKKSARSLVRFRRNNIIWSDIPSLFSPRVDIERKNPFLPADPKTLIENNQINKVPIIMGVNKNEGAYLVATLLANNGALMKKFSKDPLKYIRYSITVESLKDSDKIADRVAYKYFANNNPFVNQLSQLEQLFSDFKFFKGMDDIVRLLSNSMDQPIYYYYYAYRSSHSLTVLMGAPLGTDLGVSHADEVFLMFPNRIFSHLTNSSDIKVSKMLIDLWTSFAINGVPRSNLVLSDWTPTDKTQTRYLRIEATNPSMVNQPMPFYDRMSFIDEVLKISSG